MPIRLRALFAVLALVLFTSTAWAEKPAKAKPKAGREPSKGLFWEAKSQKGTVYLLGSVHMADKSLYPLADHIEKSFDASKALAVEADVGNIDGDMQKKMLSMGMYTDGKTSLKTVVSPETYAEASKRAEALGFPPMAMNTLKPWMAALTLTALAAQKSGLDPQLGVDMHFLNAARTGGKTIHELEGMDFQLNLFNDFPANQQDAFLFYTAKEIGQFDKQIRQMMTAWRVGDASGLEKILKQAENDAPKMKPAMEALLTKRNIGMTDKIVGYLESGETTFVVVGAAHLVGPDGIVKLLEKKGYTVERK